MVNAQDFGFNHANCIGEVGFKDGELYLCRELYVYEMDTDEIIRLAEGSSTSACACGAILRSRTVSRWWQKAGYRAKGDAEGAEQRAIAR